MVDQEDLLQRVEILIKKPKNYEKDPEYKGWKKMYEINPDVGAMHPKHMSI